MNDVYFTRMSLGIIIILVLGFGAGGVLLLLVYTVTHPRRRPSITLDSAAPSSPRDTDWTWRDLEVRGHDNVVVRGWYIETALPPRGVLVLLHGHKKSRRQMLRHVPYLRNEGYDLVLMDHRHHGASDDGLFGFGVFGRLDVACIAYQLTQIPRSSQLPIAALGVSLGATTALAAAADGVPLRAVIADSASSNQEETLSDYAKRLYALPTMVCRAACACATFITGMSLAPLELGRRLDDLAVPILIIHGTADHKVPLRHAQCLAQTKGGPRDLVTFECGHGRAYGNDPQRYNEEIAAFLRRNLTPLVEPPQK